MLPKEKDKKVWKKEFAKVAITKLLRVWKQTHEGIFSHSWHLVN